jgi:hypothetical protein
MRNDWKFVDDDNDYNKNVVNASGDRVRIKLEELLEIKDEWLDLVDRTLKRFNDSQSDGNTG